MNTHVHAWIPAYYDGELDEHRRQQVEAHLEQCIECQAELEQLGQLSRLLRSAPAPAPVVSAAHFAAQVSLRLPAARPAPAWQRTLRTAWRLAPVGLIALWTLAQAGLLAAGWLVSAGLPAGFSLGELARLPLYTGGWSWLARVSEALFASASVPFWVALAGPWLELSLINLVLTGMTAVFLCGWLASWWAQRQHELFQQAQFQPATSAAGR